MAFNGGRRGIPPQKALDIRQMLKRGVLPKAQIARAVRVGRDTVYRIWHGTHWSCRKGAITVGRCPVHGSKVFLPCRQCELEKK